MGWIHLVFVKKSVISKVVCFCTSSDLDLLKYEKQKYLGGDKNEEENNIHHQVWIEGLGKYFHPGLGHFPIQTRIAGFFPKPSVH